MTGFMLQGHICELDQVLSEGEYITTLQAAMQF